MDMLNTTNMNPIDPMTVLRQESLKAVMENMNGSVPSVVDGPAPTATTIVYRHAEMRNNDSDWSSADAIGFTIAMLLILLTGWMLIKSSNS